MSVLGVFLAVQTSRGITKSALAMERQEIQNDPVAVAIVSGISLWREASTHVEGGDNANRHYLHIGRATPASLDTLIGETRVRQLHVTKSMFKPLEERHLA